MTARLAFRGKEVKNSKPNWSRWHAYGQGFKDGLTSTWVKDIREITIKKKTSPPPKAEEKKPAGRKILHGMSVPFNTIFNKLLGWEIKYFEKPASEFKKDHKYINGALEVLTLWPAYVGLVALGNFISNKIGGGTFGDVIGYPLAFSVPFILSLPVKLYKKYTKAVKMLRGDMPTFYAAGSVVSGLGLFTFVGSARFMAWAMKGMEKIGSASAVAITSVANVTAYLAFMALFTPLWTKLVKNDTSEKSFYETGKLLGAYESFFIATQTARIIVSAIMTQIEHITVNNFVSNLMADTSLWFGGVISLIASFQVKAISDILEENRKNE